MFPVIKHAFSYQETPLTQLLRENQFIIKLSLNPVHQIFNIFRSRHLNRLLNGNSISPSVLVSKCKNIGEYLLHEKTWRRRAKTKPQNCNFSYEESLVIRILKTNYCSGKLTRLKFLAIANCRNFLWDLKVPQTISCYSKLQKFSLRPESSTD